MDDNNEKIKKITDTLFQEYKKEKGKQMSELLNFAVVTLYQLPKDERDTLLQGMPESRQLLEEIIAGIDDEIAKRKQNN